MNHLSAINKTVASAVSGLLIVLLLASCGSPQAEAGSAPEAKDLPAGASAAAETPSENPPAENGEINESEEEGAAGNDEGLPSESPPGEADAEEEQSGNDAGAAPMTPEERMAIAGEYIDQPVSALIERLGEPNDRDYAKSCFGDGEDGNLYYDGFIVFTYRENGEETVRDVDVE